ncbi:MAG TPA: hypothetical protein VFQ62_20175, partial [Methylomirabilota bacterium]|nr:hypothetical protein [Methylomirabilota bacterium]
MFTMADPGVHDADPRVHPADPGVHDADPGVHDGPIRVFTMRRSARSRSAGARIDKRNELDPLLDVFPCELYELAAVVLEHRALRERCHTLPEVGDN